MPMYNERTVNRGRAFFCDAHVEARAKSAGDMKKSAPTNLSFGCDGETRYGMSRGRQFCFPQVQTVRGRPCCHLQTLRPDGIDVVNVFRLEQGPTERCSSRNT